MGWTYGFAALLKDGTRVYGTPCSEKKGRVSFRVPEGTVRLYFIVLAVPRIYAPHPWDEKEATDEQFPYKVKFENTDLLDSCVNAGHFGRSDSAFGMRENEPFSEDPIQRSAMRRSEPFRMIRFRVRHPRERVFFGRSDLPILHEEAFNSAVFSSPRFAFTMRHGNSAMAHCSESGKEPRR